MLGEWREGGHVSLGLLYLVRLAVESTLGNTVTMADEATSRVIPMRLLLAFSLHHRSHLGFSSL